MTDTVWYAALLAHMLQTNMIFLHCVLYAHSVIILANKDTINLLSAAVNDQAFVYIQAPVCECVLFDINTSPYLFGLRDYF